MNRIRLTLDLTEVQSRRLAELEEQTGLTKAAVIREALMLYDYIGELAREGKEFHATAANGSVEKLVILSSGVSAARLKGGVR
jgi:hypothetical protein